MKDIRAHLSGPMDEVTSLMAASLRTSVSLLEKTNEELLGDRGKMMRPILCLLAAGACGGINSDTVHFAAASELLHNATLMHDDVVDGATLRRGKPTVGALLGPKASVLIGDYWLVKAMDCLVDTSDGGVKVQSVFSKTLSDLAEGEMLQLEKAMKHDTTQEDYIRIIYCKTASLFESSARSGAISAGTSEEMVETIGCFARNLGIAFQIKDDILDYVPSDALGKPSGQDLMEQKITQPLLCVLERMDADEASRLRLKLSEVPGNPALASEIGGAVVSMGGVELASAVMDSYIEKALLCLSSLPESKEKYYLARLVRYVGERSF